MLRRQYPGLSDTGRDVERHLERLQKHWGEARRAFFRKWREDYSRVVCRQMPREFSQIANPILPRGARRLLPGRFSTTRKRPSDFPPLVLRRLRRQSLGGPLQILWQLDD